MIYLARTFDNSQQIYLSMDSQMDTFLEAGCNIYRQNDDETEETLIATPEDGYLVDRPVFPETMTFTAADPEMEQAARILLGMED